VRREVLGDRHVDRGDARATALEAPFRQLITEAAWGTVWESDALPRRERSLVTLALLAGLGNETEFELHVRATVRTGASVQDIAEVLQHVAIYAGVPRANTAHRIVRRVLDEGPGAFADAGGETSA